MGYIVEEMVRVGLRMPKQQRDALDRLVAGGLYSSRSEALRAGARHIIGDVVDRQGREVLRGVEEDVGTLDGDEVGEVSEGGGVDEQGGDDDVLDVDEQESDDDVSDVDEQESDDDVSDVGRGSGEESVSRDGVFNGFFGQAMRDLERDLMDSGGDEE